MSPAASVKIDLQETFPWLERAPIVEAVIELRARAQIDWDESAVREQLASRLSDYPAPHSQHVFQQELKVEPGKSAQVAIHDVGWQGLRFESGDKRHIVQFNRDGFVFSRLEPYKDWAQFRGEALRLWSVYSELAQPAEIQRLGVRFINRIMPVEITKLADFLTQTPRHPENLPLPLSGYLHQDTFDVPGHPYAVKMIQTIQPQPTPASNEGFSLILDIDVFVTQPFEPVENLIKERLMEMRWLKNKAFFGIIKKDAVKAFQGSST